MFLIQGHDYKAFVYLQYSVFCKLKQKTHMNIGGKLITDSSKSSIITDFLSIFIPIFDNGGLLKSPIISSWSPTLILMLLFSLFCIDSAITDLEEMKYKEALNKNFLFYCYATLVYYLLIVSFCNFSLWP